MNLTEKINSADTDHTSPNGIAGNGSISETVLLPDAQNLGDLGLLSPVSTNGRNSIAYKFFVQDEDGFDVRHIQSGLKGVINEIFKTENKKLIGIKAPDYTWQNFLYLIAAIDTNLQTSNPFRLADDFGAVVGVLHACLLWSPGGLPFVLYDTIGTKASAIYPNGTAKEYRNQGIGTTLIQKARNKDWTIAQGRFARKHLRLPAGLKTSQKDKDAFYSKRSDYRHVTVNRPSGELNYVHLFGTKSPGLANYIGNLPPKFEGIG